MALSMTRTPTTLLSFAACFVLAVVPLNAAPAPRTATVEDVRAYLQKKYPAHPDNPTARLRFKAAKIVEADAPALREWLPRTRFFVTKINTTFLEYREVETLVSVSISGGKVTCQECFSPIFTIVSPEFRAQFHGLRAKSAEERRRLGEAIASLFQQITYKGGLQNGDFRERGSHIELLHNKRHYRTIHFDFDENGCLKSVKFENPVGKEKD